MHLKDHAEELVLDQKVKMWILGINDFNQGCYWEAHEKWEVGWRDLHSEEKEYMQGLIQACAAFHLLFRKNRIAPALNLTRTSLNKLRKTQAWAEMHLENRIYVRRLDFVLSQILNIENDHLKKGTTEKFNCLGTDAFKYYEELVFQLKAEIHHGEIK